MENNKRKTTVEELDNEYIDDMARLCGWKGTIVYMSLCRHAEEDGADTSIKGMAKEHGVNTDTIITGIEMLKERKVIAVESTYILLDKSQWEVELSAEF